MKLTKFNLAQVEAKEPEVVEEAPKVAPKKAAPKKKATTTKKKSTTKKS